MAAETLLALWSEKPVPIQLDFTLFRMAELAGQDPSLAERQPVGYRPLVTDGNSNGDIPMMRLARTGGREAGRLSA
jgi:hypothetical protein